MRYRDEAGQEITVYTPNERQGGLIWGLKQAWQDLWGARHIIWRLFVRDFTAQFKQRLLGYVWALIGPFMGILNFLFLYFTGVLKPGEGEMPYTLYVLLGSIIWSMLPGALGAVSGGLQAQADLLLRTRIPKMALAMTSMTGLMYGMFVNLITILIVFALYRAWPGWPILLYPFLMLPLLLLGVSMGLILAVVGVIAKDLTTIVMHGLSLLMYITPVIYLRSTITNPWISMLIDWNPITYLVDVPRSLLYYGHSENLGLYCLISGIILLLMPPAIRLFYLLEDLVAERL